MEESHYLELFGSRCEFDTQALRPGKLKFKVVRLRFNNALRPGIELNRQLAKSATTERDSL